jgi:hypothetical protein
MVAADPLLGCDRCRSLAYQVANLLDMNAALHAELDQTHAMVQAAREALDAPPAPVCVA